MIWIYGSAIPPPPSLHCLRRGGTLRRERLSHRRDRGERVSIPLTSSLRDPSLHDAYIALQAWELAIISDRVGPKFLDLDAASLFRFEIPDNFGESPVSMMVLANNRFHGCLPASIDNMPRVNEITLLNSGLRSCLLDSIGRLKNVIVFDASFNQLAVSERRRGEESRKSLAAEDAEWIQARRRGSWCAGSIGLAWRWWFCSGVGISAFDPVFCVRTGSSGVKGIVLERPFLGCQDSPLPSPPCVTHPSIQWKEQWREGSYESGLRRSFSPGDVGGSGSPTI